MIFSFRGRAKLTAELNVQPSTGKQQRGLIILCHGLLNNRNSRVIQTFNKLFLPHYDTCLLDFAGNGDSEGQTDYGNYLEEAEDLHYLISHLKTNRPDIGNRLAGIVGHSKGASVVLIYLVKYYNFTEYCNILKIFLLSGRFEMSERKTVLSRFTESQLKDLETKGRFLWKTYKIKQGSEDREYWITAESLERRHSTDMAAVARDLCALLNERKFAHLYIVHGDNDRIVPVQDASMYHETLGTRNSTLIILKGVDHFYSEMQDEMMSQLNQAIEPTLT